MQLSAILRSRGRIYPTVKRILQCKTFPSEADLSLAEVLFLVKLKVDTPQKIVRLDKSTSYKRIALGPCNQSNFYVAETFRFSKGKSKASTEVRQRWTMVEKPSATFLKPKWVAPNPRTQS